MNLKNSSAFLWIIIGISIILLTLIGKNIFDKKQSSNLKEDIAPKSNTINQEGPHKELIKNNSSETNRIKENIKNQKEFMGKIVEVSQLKESGESRIKVEVNLPDLDQIENLEFTAGESIEVPLIKKELSIVITEETNFVTGVVNAYSLGSMGLFRVDGNIYNNSPVNALEIELN